ISATALQAAMTAHPDGTYGYGFNVGADPHGHPTVSHSGGFILGAGTTFLFWPQEGVGITVLTNAQPRGLAEAIALAFGEQAMGDVPGSTPSIDWLAFVQDSEAMHSLYRPAGELAGQDHPANPTDPKPLGAYVGDYTNEYYGEA